MGLWSRIASAVGRKSSDDDSRSWSEFGAWGPSSAGVSVNSLTAMQQVAVMSCVSILSEDVAKLPLQIWKRESNGGKKPAKDHPLYKLLRRPNAWQTRFEFVEMMQAALVLRGNGYAAIVRDGRGQPTAMVPLHPDRVSVYEAPSGDIFYMVGRQGLHEMAVLRDLPLMIHSDDMLHLRWLAAGYSSLLGSSRIGLMREAVGLAIAQEQHAAHFAAQGARPSGVIETDKKLSPEVVARMVDAWKVDQGGFRNSGKTRVLEEGLSWKPLTMSMVDADFINAQRLSTEAIGRGFRVPLYKLGVPAEGQGSAMVQQDQEYLNNVLDSYCSRWVSKMEATFDVDGDETFLEFDYSHFIKADIATRYTAYRQAVGGPFLAVNEVRRAEGQPDVDHGDDVLQPTNMAKLGWTPPAPSKGPGSDTSGTTGQGGDGDAERLPGENPAPSN